MMSESLVPSIEHLPEWFITRYKRVIDFDRDFWTSDSWYPRDWFKRFEIDVKEALKEEEEDEVIRLIYFSDESEIEAPDILYVAIDRVEIKTLRVLSLLEHSKDTWDIR